MIYDNIAIVTEVINSDDLSGYIQYKIRYYNSSETYIKDYKVVPYEFQNPVSTYDGIASLVKDTYEVTKYLVIFEIRYK